MWQNQGCYHVTFGLVPYFINELHRSPHKCLHVVLLFVESFLIVTLDEQMDGRTCSLLER